VLFIGWVDLRLSVQPKGGKIRTMKDSSGISDWYRGRDYGSKRPVKSVLGELCSGEYILYGLGKEIALTGGADKVSTSRVRNVLEEACLGRGGAPYALLSWELRGAFQKATSHIRWRGGRNSEVSTQTQGDIENRCTKKGDALSIISSRRRS